jgi:uncharacterized membrane protein
MFYRVLADVVLLFHLAFIFFVVLGSLLVWRFPRLARLHLPAVMWAGVIEISGRVCPLTPLENHLRRLSGEAGYLGGFVEHYLLPIIYPHALSRELQLGLGIAVIAINVVVYTVLYLRKKRHEG